MKYATEICENRPRSHISDIIRLGLTTATEMGKTHVLTELCMLLCYGIARMILFSCECLANCDCIRYVAKN